MINLPFKVGPGVADRFVTEAGYISGSFVFVNTIADFQELSTNNKYSLKEGVPVYVRTDAAGNVINKIYKYKADVADVTELPSYDFLKENLIPDHLYVWKNNEWFDATDLLDTPTIKNELEELKRNLNNEILAREQSEANINLRLKALEKLEQTVIEIRNELGSIEVKIDTEIARAKKEEENLKSLINEAKDNFEQTKIELRQDIDQNRADINKNKADINQNRIDIDQNKSDAESAITYVISDYNDKITAETNRAEAAEKELKNSIADTNNNLENTKNELQRSIIDEAQIRAAQDQILTNSINTANDKIDQEIKNRAASIENEEKERKEADTALNEAIQEETRRATTEEAAITEKLNEETNRATAAEQDINEKIGDGFTKDEPISKQLADEIARAKSVEGELNQLKTTDKSNLVAAINSEVDRAKAAEGNLSQLQTTEKGNLVAAINDEVNRAKTEESRIDKKLDGEIARAKATEGDLNNLTTDAEGNLVEAINEVVTDLNKEQTRATEAETALAGRVTTIESKIPTQASPTNQLADKAFVNSSINALAAYYITRNANGDPFRTYDELINPSKTSSGYFSGGVTRNPTSNDYAIVQADEEIGEKVPNYTSFTTVDEYINHYIIFDNKEVDVNEDNKNDLNIVPGITVAYLSLPTTRYTYQGGTYPTAGQWQYQYTINRTALTAAQIAAINSGITEKLVEQITTNQTNITTNTSDIASNRANITTNKNDIADIKTKNAQQDTAIQAAQSTADTNKTNIGTIGDLTTNAKNNLVEAINELNSNIGTASSDLQSAIDAEKARATTEEDNLKTAIEAEATTARAAEKKNADAIAAETARADAAEKANAANITKNATAIQEEQARAKTAEENLDKKKVDVQGGELKDTITTFDDYTIDDANIASGEKTSTIFGKIKKWFGRLKALAFKSTVGTADIDDSAVTSAKIADGTIVNADINTNAAIAQSKIDGLPKALTDINTRITDLTYNDLKRIQVKGYTGTGAPYWYYPVATLPIDNDGNYASVIITGRIGGWVKDNMSYINAIVSNRSGETGSLIELGDNINSALSIADIVLYRQSTNSTIVYLKVKSYFTFDLNVNLMQATYSFDGSYVTAPEGTNTWSASTAANKLTVDKNGAAVATKKVATEEWVNDQDFMPKTGGTFTGTVNFPKDASIDTNGYVTGTWLRTTANVHSASAASSVAVLSSGWIYSRTAEEFRDDIGVTTLENSLDTLRQEFDDFSYKAPEIKSFVLTGTVSAVDLTSTSLTRSVTGYTYSIDNVSNIKNNLTFAGEGKSYSVTPAASKTETISPAISITFSSAKTSATFTLSCEGVKGENVNKTVTISSYYPLFYGASATKPTATNLDAATVSTTVTSGFGKKSSSGNSGSFTITYKDNDYVWFCTTGTITKVTSSGYDVTIFQDGTLSYKGTTYNLYKTLQLAAGSATFTI